MERLFEEWYLSSSTSNDLVITDESINANDKSINANDKSINKNDKSILKGILLGNHRHQKREMDENFLIEQRESKGTELFEKITPFVTDKTKLVDSLEEDRLCFLEKRLKVKNKKKTIYG
tara:strand:+ start:1243 stop:1602 length:360 start_codon:yes stop_codon:yes gene_type:complete